MGVGVAFAAASTFGADSVALLWEGMHLRLGMSLGTANLLFSFLFLVAVVIVDYKQIGLGTILSPVIEGIAIDICGLLFQTIAGFYWQLLACLTGILLIAIGTGIYAAANIGKGPYIGITFAMEKKYHWSLTKFRVILDLLCLLIGILLGAHLSIGPLFSVLLMGIVTEHSCIFVEQHLIAPYVMKSCH